MSRGLLEGSRDREVNQSYFNFLYGKTEEERFELLQLLEKGDISPKKIAKVSSLICNVLSFSSIFEFFVIKWSAY